jgi:uncharacterized membrane protein (DUF485 family)
LKTPEEIAAHPKFIELRRVRHRLVWPMAALGLGGYLGFVLVMAYGADWLGQPIDQGHATSIGLPIGAGVIVFTFIVTIIYTWLANKQFEKMTADLKKDLSK